MNWHESIFKQLYRKFKNKNPDIKDDINHTIENLSFSVVGINYEGRLQKLTKAIKGFKDKGRFDKKLYRGWTDEGILYNSNGRRVYELNGAYFTDCHLVKEDNNEHDPNALMVYIKDVNKDDHHIGYVPSELCEQIRSIMSGRVLRVKNSIVGGTYKYVEGKEVLKYKMDYGLNIYILTTKALQKEW